MFLVRSTLVLLHKWDLDVALKIIPKYIYPSSPERPLTLFTRYRITALFLIPSVVHQLVNSPKMKKADLSSVLFIGSGAAYLPDSLARQMSRMAPNLAFNTVSEGNTSTFQYSLIMTTLTLFCRLWHVGSDNFDHSQAYRRGSPERPCQKCAGFRWYPPPRVRGATGSRRWIRGRD